MNYKCQFGLAINIARDLFSKKVKTKNMPYVLVFAPLMIASILFFSSYAFIKGSILGALILIIVAILLYEQSKYV